MSEFTIFNTGTGRIRSVSTCSASAIEGQLREGEAWMEGRHPEGCMFVTLVDGIPTFDPERRPDAPDEPGCVWDAAARRWSTLGDRAATARARRSAALLASDWTQLADADLAGPERQAWVTYRKALRDLTEQPGFPDAIDWPVPPA